MKIKLYLVGYRSRWGDSGVTTHYTKREQIESLFSWLVPTEQNEIRGLLDEHKYDAAWDRLEGMLDSSGHEWYPQDVEVDISKTEGGAEIAKDIEFLSALRAAGVDNWEGYSEACRAVSDEEDEE